MPPPLGSLLWWLLVHPPQQVGLPWSTRRNWSSRWAWPSQRGSSQWMDTWLISMVIVSPLTGVVRPLPNGHSMAYTWDFLLGKQVACRMSAAKWGQLWMVVSTIFLFSPLLGEMIKFDAYFSDALKPPTNMPLVLPSGLWQINHTFIWGQLLKWWCFPTKNDHVGGVLEVTAILGNTHIPRTLWWPLFWLEWKGIVLEGWPSKIEVNWALGIVYLPPTLHLVDFYCIHVGKLYQSHGCYKVGVSSCK